MKSEGNIFIKTLLKYVVILFCSDSFKTGNHYVHLISFPHLISHFFLLLLDFFQYTQYNKVFRASQIYNALQQKDLINYSCCTFFGISLGTFARRHRPKRRLFCGQPLGDGGSVLDGQPQLFVLPKRPGDHVLASFCNNGSTKVSLIQLVNGKNFCIVSYFLEICTT